MNNILCEGGICVQWKKQTVFIGTAEETASMKTVDIVLCENISKPEQMKPKWSTEPLKVRKHIFVIWVKELRSQNNTGTDL